MKRIIIHWTVGRYNQLFPLNYHYMINDKGEVFEGKFKPEDNENCQDGKYAQHTGGGNTGSIGVALCAMYGYKSMQDVGDYPITRKQIEACFELCAKLCKEYKIPIQEIYTHYSFNKKHNIKSGKIDIIYLPPFPNVKINDIESFIRSKVNYYKVRG